MTGCAVAGNLDLYGIGIRIGIYAPWLATLIADLLTPSEVDAMKNTNTCFQCGIFCALLLEQTKEKLRLPDVLIVLPLCFGGFAATGTAPTGINTGKEKKSSAIQMFIVMQVLGALGGFSSWFWWEGVKTLGPFGCTHYTFLFAKVSVARVRVFYCVVSVAICSIFLFFETLFLYWSLSIVLGVGPKEASRLLSSVQTRLVKEPYPQRWRSYVHLCCRLSLLSWMLISTELAIYWNDLGGVYSISTVGQLVPFVGVTGLVRIAFGICKKLVGKPNI